MGIESKFYGKRSTLTISNMFLIFQRTAKENEGTYSTGANCAIYGGPARNWIETNRRQL